MGCRTVKVKTELIRLYRTPEGSVEADPGGRRGGRGAYLCPDERCLAEALKRRRFGQAFRAPVTIDPTTRERLLALVAAAGKTHRRES